MIGWPAQAGDHLVQSVGGDGPSTTLHSHTPGDRSEGTNVEKVNVTPRRQGIASQCFSFLRSGDISDYLRIQGIPGQSNMLNTFEGFGVWLSFVPLLVQGCHTTMAS